MKKLFLCMIAMGLLLLSPPLVISQVIYRVERMWPVLKQPWYFFQPADLATDSKGNIYITDFFNHQVKKLSQDGSLITTWGTRGNRQGQFIYPKGISVDKEDNVYVVDKGNFRIQKFTPHGSPLSMWPVNRETGESEVWLKGIAIDKDGFVYVTDENNYCVKKFNQAGTLQKKWGSQGSPDIFKWPYGIAVDNAGNIYVADNGNDKIKIISAADDSISEWDAFGSEHQPFNEPYGITIDSTGNVYVSNCGNGLIQKFSPDGNCSEWVVEGEPQGIAVSHQGYIFVIDEVNKSILKFSPDGTSLSSWGSTGTGYGEFNYPYGIAVYEGEEGTSVFIADTFNHRIQKCSEDGSSCTEFCGGYGSGNGSFNQPRGIALDAAGNLYVADEFNHRIQKFTALGAWEATWPMGSSILYPNAIAVDAAGEDIYVAVAEGIGYQYIMKLNPDGTFTKWGIEGISNGRYNQPKGIAIAAPSGNIYIADTGNNRIQKFNAAGEWQNTWGGTVPGSVLGMFNSPIAVAVDIDENLYVADTGNDRIQKLGVGSVIWIEWGKFGSHPGQMNSPTGLAADSEEKVFLADSGNNRIQVFNEFDIPRRPKAIIVAGGGPYPGNNLWDATLGSTNFAYRTLTYLGFDKNDIFYLSEDTDIDLDYNGKADDVDRSLTFSNLEYAVTQWPVAQNAESLILYLSDHGGNNSFVLKGGEDSVQLSAETLKQWLDTIKDQITDRIIVVYDACESGSFVDDLSGENRIIVTSTLPGERAKFLGEGTISFSNFFWTHILNGLSVDRSFDKASQFINFAFSNQNPMVSGDAGNVYIEKTRVTGAAGNAPLIDAISPDQYLKDDENTAPLFAYVAPDPDGIARVWAEIWPPNNPLGTPDIPLIDQLPRVELLPTDEAHHYAASYTGFEKDGVYQVAVYAMDGKNNTSLPKVTTVSKNYSEERKAIVVAGGSSAAVTPSMIESNASLAYKALEMQLYDDDDIYFMSPSDSFDDIVWDDDPSKDNLQAELQKLAANGDIANLDLTIYLIGAGNTGTFTMNDEADPNKILSAAELHEWLDNLQAAKPGRITIIYDGDKSGSFITPLATPAGSERIIITSSGEDGAAYFSGAGDICFSTFFWGQVADGATLYNAFSYARQAIAYLSLTKEISFSCYPQQNPLLDADGDGNANRTADYAIARARTIGIGLKFAADPPAIGSASVNEDEGEVRIRASNITATSKIQRVWAVIKPLAYCPGYSGEETQELTEVTLDPDPTEEGSYEAIYTNPLFAFKATVYAMDVDGATSAPQETKIFQAGGDIFEPDDRYYRANVIVINYPSPQPHTFHYEGDEDWVKFYGKEGQDYTIEADNLNQNCPVIELYREDDLTTPVTVMYDPPVDGSVKLPFPCTKSSIYYARLLRGGCSWVADMSYDLKVYDNFIGLTALVAGKVRNSVSGKVIDGAVITSNGIGAAISTRGDYIFSEVPGSWTITSRKESYATSRDSIRIEADEEYVRKNIGMYPMSASGCVTAADCDDGIFCNGEETCVDKTCQPGTSPCPDDGIFCNGEETCSEEDDSCGHAGNPCQSNLTCDEERNACVGCLEDNDCDDGFFCTGIESCLDGACQAGTDPCPEGVVCDEEADECEMPTLTVIPQAIMQSHWMPLPVFMSIRGTNTHFGNSSSLAFNPPSVMALPMMINPETIFCFGLMMPAWITGQSSESLEISITTGSENATGSVEIMLLPFMLGEVR